MSELIRRKDTVELLKNDMENNGLPLDDEYNIGIDHAMCLLACVPTAEPKAGRWIPYKAYIGKKKDSWVDELKCSECGYGWGDEGYNYCPNCGAKME